jgi:hypothetical protein
MVNITSHCRRCLLAVCLTPVLLSGGCATDFRDAMLAGLMDFVTSTVSDALGAILTP